jgi:histidyl-tRNA synthetase
MSHKFAGVKGMNDLLPPHTTTWQRVESQARALFACYGYHEVRTPIVEDTSLFVRSVGEVTDIVKKEMYTFEDKGGRSITLRPEGTAPAARAYIEHGVANTEPVTRWFYIGPMFRYERMKTGRYRQFYQLGAEAYGSADPSLDVEVIALTWELLRRLGVPDVVLHLNSLGEAGSRPKYVEALKAHFAPILDAMSSDAKDTFERNPMRLLDSKEAALAESIASAPAILDFIDDASKQHFDEVQRLLDKLNIPWTLDRRLVRGLDYYTRTTFEFIYEPKTGENALGTAGTLCGGGRYDGLVHELGGPEKPAVGFALGLDRLVMLVEAGHPPAVDGPTLFIGTFDGPLRADAVAAVMRLRNAGHRVDFDPRGGKLKRQIERADKLGARYFATWGEKEVQTGKLELKALALPDDHPQKITTVELAALEAWLSLKAKAGQES